MKSWYALNNNGDIVKVENVSNFDEADEKTPESVWIVDNEGAKKWFDSLAEEFVKPYLIRMLQRGNHHTEGDITVLLERLEHMVNGDHDLHAMNKTYIGMLKKDTKEKS